MVEMSEREMLSAILERLTILDARATRVEETLNYVQGDIAELKRGQVRLEKRLGSLESSQTRLEKSLDSLENKQANLEKNFSSLYALMVEIKAIVERNETEIRILWSYVSTLANVLRNFAATISALPAPPEMPGNRLAKESG